tara:strand:+ start:65 stop:934 length:870 start_codon:yes stop_codon:yes gene_type:complete
MSIQLPDGSVVSNWSPGWEKNLPQWYIDGYETGLFNESNNWGRDFFPQTTYNSPTVTPPVIPGGPGMVPGYPTNKGSQIPGVRESTTMMGRNPDGTPITLGDTPSIGMPKYPKDFPDLSGDLGDTPPKPFKDFSGGLNNPPRPEGLQRVATGIADWVTGNKFDFDQRGPGKKFLDAIKGAKNAKTGKTVAQDLAEKPPVPPIDPLKVLPPTLRQRVWERDQMPERVPNELGQLYPDKNDPGFIDPRIQGDGSMTMQYIPELDDPNWRPWKDYGPGWKEKEMFGSGTLPM